MSAASPDQPGEHQDATAAPATTGAARAHHYAQALRSGFEGHEAELGAAVQAALERAGSTLSFAGREDELGRSVGVVLKTLQNVRPYVHEVNDAVVKAHLMAIQFAKDRGSIADLVEQDVRTMRPINQRLRMVVEKSGYPEIALIGMFDHTGCHYQFVLDTRVEPGRRSWRSPFGRVLHAARSIGQFDLTEREVHEQWMKPRILGYAGDIGVRVSVSDWRDDGLVVVDLLA
jgi:hypothetical protein